MKIDHSEKRLKKFWGKVDQKHIRLISSYLKGNNILDIGCGYGTTTDYIANLGFNCMGIDYEESTVELCKKLYPRADFRVMNAEEMSFDDHYFDTIILRDSLHHLFGEADFQKIQKEIARVAKMDSRIIFFDPNVNFILKTMRKLSFHKDQECNVETARQIMNDLGFKIVHQSFNTIYSLPLSGGYVGINYIPNIKFIQNTVLVTEKYFEKLVNRIGLGRYLCWRYIIVGQK